MIIEFFDKSSFGRFYMTFRPEWHSFGTADEIISMMTQYLESNNILYCTRDETINFQVYQILDMNDYVLLKLTFSGQTENDIIQLLTQTTERTT